MFLASLLQELWPNRAVYHPGLSTDSQVPGLSLCSLNARYVEARTLYPAQTTPYLVTVSHGDPVVEMTEAGELNPAS